MVQAADITFSMVSHTAALQAVMGGPERILAGLRPGTVVVDMSTVSPAASRELATQVAAASAHMRCAGVWKCDYPRGRETVDHGRRRAPHL